MPTFLSVTLPLVSQTRGNVWLFEDSVLITGKFSEPLPNVQFQRNLLTVPECNISTITAYLTVPQPSAEKSVFYNTMGVLNSKSGYRSIELKPVAAVSIELSCNSRELQVTGPIHITLPLPGNTGLSVSHPVPAWTFDRAKGAWGNQGLGIVKMQDGAPVWSFIAPQLGLWIAAPYPSSNGDIGNASHAEFYQQAYLLLAFLSGAIIILSGIVTVLLCRCRHSSSLPAAKRTRSIQMDSFKRDQTTSTNSMYQQANVSHKDSISHGDATQKAHVSSVKSQTNVSVNFKGRRLNHYVDSSQLPRVQQYRNAGNAVQQAYTNATQTAWSEGGSDRKTVPVALNEKVFFSERIVHVYNQPVGLLQAQDFFVSAKHPSSTKSTTLPRQVTDGGAQTEELGKDGCTQTHPKSVSPPSESQRERGDKQQESAGSQGSTSSARAWGRFNTLLESVSVPGTLNEAAAAMGPLASEHQGTSEQDLRGLSKHQPLPHPRAWFVSLEGKPIAQIRHSVLNLHRCLHRASDKTASSLDSGVDMNEHVGGGGGGRRLERERTFVRSSAHSRTQRLCSDDMDLSSSESATTATCTPEDPSLRNILDGVGGAMPHDIPEERDDGGGDTSSAQEDSESRSTPSPRRMRRDRDKSRAERPRSTWHMREERPLMKLN
ncbi:hypothetical protein ACEWY4_023130 [Coilia grayii]|uniref:Protein FAM171B n=1 Tax=Coilia grayii TaxID=363190 RepID=A0ABD1J297_9TELE